MHLSIAFDRETEQTFTGFSEQPGYEDAQEVGEALIEAFTAGLDDVDGIAAWDIDVDRLKGLDNVIRDDEHEANRTR